MEHTIDVKISDSLRNDPRFRHSYFRSESRNEIAAQIIELRKRRKMTQKVLAQAAATGQPAISRLEKADYARWSNQMLERIAESLNARWRHILEPVEDVIKQYEQEELATKDDTTDISYAGIGADKMTPIFIESKEDESGAVTVEMADTQPTISGNVAYVPVDRNGVIYHAL